MAKKKLNSSDASYEIGRNKPPSWTQFKKGRSGNPAGRPKRPKPTANDPDLAVASAFDAMLKSQFERKVTVNEAGTPKRCTVAEVIFKAHVKTALSGNAFAQRELLREVRALERREAERAKAKIAEEQARREAQREEYALACKYKQQQTRVWAEAQARGQEPDDPWPHPDDILLSEHDQRWNIRGPFSNDNVLPFERIRAQRDYMFAMAVRALGTSERTAANPLSVYNICWLAMDAQLPYRWQIAHCSDLPFFQLSILTDKQLGREIERRHALVENFALFDRPDPARDRQIYRITNEIMKPLLKKHGYRSLAQFETQYEQTKEGNANIPVV